MALQLFLVFVLISSSSALLSETSRTNEITKQGKRQYSTLGGALYPQASETRDVKTLDGIWNFRKDKSEDPEFGYLNGWFKSDLFKILFTHVRKFTIKPYANVQIEIPNLLQASMALNWYQQDLKETGPVSPMPVPSSYNDIGEDSALRDHVGLVWYDRRFYVPRSWLAEGQRVWLRFSSVHYAAQVWVNGQVVAYHEIGHLPFEVDITDVVHTNTSNLLTVAVDNMLSPETVPQGRINYDSKTNRKPIQSYTFDFFNYAGIHRSVFLYSTPQVYIDDVVVNTDIQGLTGFVIYNATFRGASPDTVSCLVQLLTRNGTHVIGHQDCSGLLEVPNANFWWPYLMHEDPGYLYELKVSLVGNRGELLDTYTQKVGIRTITWNNQSMFINEKPIYFRGFGMHEDSDMRGKGWDPVLWVKNFNLIRWTGGNAFRTSHYPYAEEIYQLADEQGIMILDECPSVDTDIFSDELLKKHKQSLTELIRRDKNHPSVVLWSIANEPRTQHPAADNYFGQVVKHVKSMDLSRPVSLAMAQPLEVDKAAKHLDLIMFNRYYSWYIATGDLDKIVRNVVIEASRWHKQYNKPVLMSEYGADAIAGMHLYPEYVWSEEFQASCLAEHFKAFDRLRKTGFFIGEFIWNFADFNTAQTTGRAGGNKKGMFTRNRQPKASAHLLRVRYHELAAADDGVIPPTDLLRYSSDNTPAAHSEL